ncbi:MAG TPA: protoporphyrinogen oxidase [Coriobacteriia bacterium]|nr:protoporphyrinogen oxidase [Coriobacteriia bacterium]
MKKVIIIGGGAAGLGAAYKIKRAAEAGVEVSCTVIEKEDRLGGKLASDVIADAEGAGDYIVDGGSDAFIMSKPAVPRIARLLGIADEMTPANEVNKKTLILKGKKLVEMPDGIMMFAPTKLVPLATSKLYSWPAKLRMALDLILPRKVVWAEGEGAQQHDETLESLIVRRMGRECLDRLAEPLVGGVHASDPKEMSVAATFPNFLEMEQQFGSLIKGMLAQRKTNEEMRKKYPPKPGEKPRAFFNTFRLGMQQLTNGMADAAGRENIIVGRTVSAVARTQDGWQVTLDDGQVLSGDAVIVATEVWAAEELMRPVDTGIADLLATIPCSSSATVPMAFKQEDFCKDQKWFGILCPLVEGRPMLAVTLSSSKWPGRTPEGRVLIRGFIGGPANQHLLEAGDDELIETVRREIVDMLGLKPDAKPVMARVYRWIKGMPQYTLNHLDRVDEIEARVGDVSGLGLAGGGFRGVGIPNCIESGERAVSKVLGDFGISLAEDQAKPAHTH